MANRIRELRNKLGYTQQALAKMLQTTQQTVGRWETGAAQPSVASLRDMAMIFGCSVDDIIGVSPIKPEVSAIRPEDYDGEGFWGHLGLKLVGEKHTRWFPITTSEADGIRVALQVMTSDHPWCRAVTLNNRVLLFRPSTLQRIWLLDDACDEPEDDWEIEPAEYAGQPLEFYRGVGEWVAKQWGDRGEEASETYQSIINDFVSARGFTAETAHEWLLNTTIHFVDGERVSYWADAGMLNELLIDWSEGYVPAVVTIDSQGGAFESYYPSERVALIDMPLIDILDAAKRLSKRIDKTEVRGN